MATHWKLSHLESRTCGVSREVVALRLTKIQRESTHFLFERANWLHQGQVWWSSLLQALGPRFKMTFSQERIVVVLFKVEEHQSFIILPCSGRRSCNFLHYNTNTGCNYSSLYKCLSVWMDVWRSECGSWPTGPCRTSGFPPSSLAGLKLLKELHCGTWRCGERGSCWHAAICWAGRETQETLCWCTTLPDAFTTTRKK